MRCQICDEKNEIIEINGEKYYFCHNCNFLQRVNLLTEEKEKERYDLHICDDKYNEYMGSVFLKIKDFISGNVLDFGCGKTHILSDIINDNGLNCDYYDYYYYPNLDNRKYDTIILIEVIEHILDSKTLFFMFDSLLNVHGKLIIMTNFLVKDLNNWWYIRDKTHISIYNLKCFEILAEKYNYNIIYTNNKNLIVLEKK